MHNYYYIAVSEKNQKHYGTKVANDVTHLYALLVKENLYCTRAIVVSSEKKNKKLTNKEIAVFCNQLSSMLASGITIPDSLILLIRNNHNNAMLNVYFDIYERIQKGATLSIAMANSKYKFPGLLIELIKSGEISGSLVENVSRMARHYEKENKLKGKIASAMTYPIILLVVTIVIVVGLMTVVLPRFFSQFSNVELPWNTILLMNISKFLINDYIYLIVFAGLSVLGWNIYMRKKNNRMRFDRLLLNLPLFGKLLVVIYTGSFARTFSSLYRCGINVMEALELTRSAFKNTYVINKLKVIEKNVERGIVLSEAIASVNVFEPMLTSMLLVGEKAGTLSDMLDFVADYYEESSERAIGQMVSLIEPIMIIILAVIIAFILFSVMIPLYTSMGNLS